MGEVAVPSMEVEAEFQKIDVLPGVCQKDEKRPGVSFCFYGKEHLFSKYLFTIKNVCGIIDTVVMKFEGREGVQGERNLLFKGGFSPPANKGHGPF